MMILNVKDDGTDVLQVSWPANHPKGDQIQKWLKHLSAGYVEWMLRAGSDPHCSNCRDMGCDNVGMFDDACAGFKYGEDW